MPPGKSAEKRSCREARGLEHACDDRKVYFVAPRRGLQVVHCVGEGEPSGHALLDDSVHPPTDAADLLVGAEQGVGWAKRLYVAVVQEEEAGRRQFRLPCPAQRYERMVQLEVDRVALVA